MIDNELYHYGTPRHSGRYPWGSGEHPYQSANDFLDAVKQFREEGMSDKEIADYFGYSLNEFKAKKSNARNEAWAANSAQALRLKDKGYSNVAIGQRMGVPESTVRNWLNPAKQERANKTNNTADVLRSSLEEHRYIDIGSGIENQLGVSRNTLDYAIDALKDEGYKIMYLQVEQLGTNGNKTSIKTLVKNDVTYSELMQNKDKIGIPNSYSEDHGSTMISIKPPVSISSDRIKVNYGDGGDTGKDKDGVIELRRGVEDISLGNAKYAQVRIAVDGTHYLKGMAMYSDDIPEGYDIIFNTNKHKGTPKCGEESTNSVFKKMKSEEESPGNPFGATIKRQRTWVDSEGKTHQSALNIVNEEGDWSSWKKTLSSQFLSKQSSTLAKRQLKMSYDLKKSEFDEIMSLTNPVVKQELLNKFADECDSASYNLKAAGLPRQASKVILPLPDIKPNEIYAPTFRDGEKVVLVRYPHGGIFEIPELVVNNNGCKSGKRLMHNAKDAVGIHPSVAERLSGADFDGDTVLVIPTAGAKIKTSSPLKGLKDFDPKESYPAYEGMIKTGSPGSGYVKQKQMGTVSNLITDMTIKGASPNELARAVRHSMVVIDAEKHNLNYKQSYIDNGIAELKEKYQGGKNRGASTLISRARGQMYVPHRKPKYITVTDPETGKTRRTNIDPTTGKKLWEPTGETYINRQGKEVRKTTKTHPMLEVDDAHDLSSGQLIENVYADHANRLKSLANTARKESYFIKPISYSPEAKKRYSKEVDSLNAKLNLAKKNRPFERKAQAIANVEVSRVKRANPDLDNDDLKKLKGRALAQARISAGAHKAQIQITPNEWEAIQAGAISTNKLREIINNSDMDVLKQQAMPRDFRGMSPAKERQARSLANRGYTLAEIADQLGVSTSTVANVL